MNWKKLLMVCRVKGAFLGSLFRFAVRSFVFAVPLFAVLPPLYSQSATELGSEGDLTILGMGGTALDPNTKIKGFTVFGSTQAAYTGAVVGNGNVVVNGVLTVSSGTYFVGNSTFTGAGKIFVNDGDTGQVLRKNAGGYLEWSDTSAMGDNLGNHTAAQDLLLAGFSIVNAASGTFTQGITASSFTAAGIGVRAAQLRLDTANNIVVSSETSAALGAGIRVSTNVYIVGFSSAAKYYGDGSGLTGVVSETALGSKVSGSGTADWVTKFQGSGNAVTNSSIYDNATVTVLTNPSSTTIYGKDASSGYSLVLSSGLSMPAGTVNAGQLRFNSNISISSEPGAAYGGGVRVSTNIYIVGFSSAARYYGDGSGLTGISGDNLGNHIATAKLNMNGNPVIGISSLTIIAPDTLASSLWVSTSAKTPHLYVSTNGNVGIGTTTPNSPLTIARSLNNPAINLGSFAYYPNAKISGELTGNTDTYWSGLAGLAIDLKTSMQSPTQWNASYGVDVIARTSNDGVGNQEAYGVMSKTETHPGDYGYSYYAEDVNASTGGNQYGLYIKLDNTNVNRYGIYQETVNNNYFAGNIGIGTTGPLSKFDVSDGSITVRGTNAGLVLENASRVISPETSAALGAGVRVSTNVYIVGFSSATKYYGDGSALTGLTAVGDNLGNHNATQRLNLAGNQIIGVSSLTIIAPDTLASSLWVSTSAISPHLYVSTGGYVGIGGSYFTTLWGGSADLAIHGGDGLGIFQWSANTNGPDITAHKSRGTAVGVHAAVQPNDELVFMSFGGSDGTAFQESASIGSHVDGVVAANSVPGRLEFHTTSVGNQYTNERMRITSDGYVGIGTAGPLSKFDVSDGSITVRGTNAGLVLENASRVISPETSAALGAGVRVSTNVYIVGFSSATKYYGDGSALTGLTAVGDNLGNHNATQRLNLAGNQIIGVSSLTIIAPDTLASSLWVSTSAISPHLYVSTNGNVGIGTTGPNSALHVIGNSDTQYYSARFVSNRSDGWGGIMVQSGGAGGVEIDMRTANNNGWAQYVEDASGSLFFWDAVNSLDRVSLTQGGNMGLGTRDPTANLHVSSTSASASQDMLKVTTGTANADVFVIKGSGNVGIGLNAPSAQGLHIHTSGVTDWTELKLTNSASGIAGGDGLVLGMDANAVNSYLWNKENGSLYFGTNDTERMRIERTGNIGIGTTAPLSKFDVSDGSITVRGTNAGLVLENASRVISPETSAALGAGVRVSTNVYIVGFSSATKYYGDGSGLTGITGGSAGPSIDVSTINATATTPYGGVNITTNTFVQGKVTITGGSSKLSNTVGDISVEPAGNNLNVTKSVTVASGQKVGFEGSAGDSYMLYGSGYVSVYVDGAEVARFKR